MDEKKNDNFAQEWNPADYQIYLQEDRAQPQPQQQPRPQPRPQPARTPYAGNSGKRTPPKKKNGGNAWLKVLIVFLLIAILAVGILLAKSFKTKFTQIRTTTTAAQSAESNTVKVTFPEGFTVMQMAERLEENGVCKKDDFLAAANTPVEGLEISNAENRIFLLEGYLFPDTYEFYRDESAESVVNRFVQNYKAKVTPEMEAQAQALGYSMDEMLTLASIIQKECDEDIDECRNVSSVFHNRLKASRQSYLGSDVTYFYIKNLTDYLGGKDSENYTRFLSNYYTYSPYHKGLPVGPICNPSLKAIEAALSPNDTDYQFFLTDKSGKTFYYAETYQQHLQNAKEAGLS